ncbi:MAG TPA: hypothetical protein VF407_14015 [Polyangiaceae bacterium]
MKKTLLVLASVTAFAALVACKAKVDLGTNGGADNVLGTGGFTAPGGGGGSTSDAITVLGKAHVGASSLVLDSQNVYWVDENPQGGVWGVSKSGGSETELASCTDCVGSTIAVDSTRLYVPTSKTISAVPLGGGAPAALVSLGEPVGGVTRNSENLFWVESGPSLLGGPDGGALISGAAGKSLPLEGGAEPIDIPLPDELVSSTQPVSFLFASAKAIFASDPTLGVIRMPYDGSAASVLPVIGSPLGIASDDVDVFVANGQTISKVSIADGVEAQLLGGNTSMDLAPYEIALDGDTIYFTDQAQGGRIFRMVLSTPGVTLTQLADQQGMPTSIAVDETSVYWIAADEGAIKKIAK